MNDADMLIQLKRIEQIERANHMLLTAILARLERAGIGEPKPAGDPNQDNGN